jgi:hypothetical protein
MVDPHNGQVALGLMRALVVSGDRSAALQHYRVLKRSAGRPRSRRGAGGRGVRRVAQTASDHGARTGGYFGASRANAETFASPISNSADTPTDWVAHRRVRPASPGTGTDHSRAGVGTPLRSRLGSQSGATSSHEAAPEPNRQSWRVSRPSFPGVLTF